jgi:hypothetical protein
VDAREAPSGFPEAFDEANRHRVRPSVEHDRNAFRSALGGKSNRGRKRIDEVYPLPFETPRRHVDQLQIALGVTHVEDEVLSVLESQFPETVPQPCDCSEVGASLKDDSYAIDARLLCLSVEGGGEERNAPGQKCAAIHYSIT